MERLRIPVVVAAVEEGIVSGEAASSAAERITTPIFRPNASSIAPATTFATAAEDFRERKTTLPLCSTVATSSSPASVSASRSFAIGTLLFPPTLTARRNATYAVTAAAVSASS